MSQFEIDDEVPSEGQAIKAAIRKANVEEYKKDIKGITRDDHIHPQIPILSLPRYDFDSYITTLGGMAFKDVFALPDNPASKNYQRVIGNSVNMLSRQNWDKDNLNKESHNWVVGLRGSENGPAILGGDYIVDSSESVKGEPAILKASKRLGSGVSKAIPLENSGFYITLIPSKSPQLAAMMVEILSKGEDIGYRTGGVGYDLGSTFIEQEIMAHIFGNIRSSTLIGVPIDEIQNYIKVSDYRRLIISQLWATYQTGIIYDQPCIANHNTCQAVHSNKLNLASLLRINAANFTDDQYKHLLRSRNGVTLEDVKRYHTLNVNNSREYRISGDEDDANQVNITISVPYIVGCHSVYTDIINYLTTMLPRALSEHGTAKSRNEWLSAQLKAVPVLSNLAWISKLTIGKEGVDDVQTFETIEDIREIITCLTDNDEFNETTDAFIEAYSDFMLRNDTSMVLIRNEPCPACNSQVVDSEGNIPTHIPLEAESLFLAIVQYRLIAKGRLRQYVI